MERMKRGEEGRSGKEKKWNKQRKKEGKSFKRRGARESETLFFPHITQRNENLCCYQGGCFYSGVSIATVPMCPFCQPEKLLLCNLMKKNHLIWGYHIDMGRHLICHTAYICHTDNQKLTVMGQVEDDMTCSLCGTPQKAREREKDLTWHIFSKKNWILFLYF